MKSKEPENALSQNESATGTGNTPRREAERAGLLIAAILEAVFLIWLFGHGRDAVCRRIISPDTAGYVLPAMSILHRAGLPPDMTRAIGYPLFLTAPFWLGGEQYGYHLTIVMQSVMNLLGTLLVWRLLAAMLPHIRVGITMAAVGIFWYAGFGLALNVLSDFLFGFLLLVFLYTFWIQRTLLWLAVGASALLAAGLTRPTLGPFLLLLPLLRVLVQRRFPFIPKTSVAVYATVVVASSGVNFALEHARGDRCSESFNSFAMRYAISDRGTGTMSISKIALRIAESAGRPWDQLTRHERDIWSRRLFVECVSAQPLRFVLGIAVNALKYIVSPVEFVVAKIVAADAGQAETFARSPIRAMVILLGLPIWLLALWPGMARRPETRDLYLFTVLISLYFIGISSAFAGGGERLRFPALPMLLVCFAANLDRLVGWINSRLIQPGGLGLA